MSSVKTIHFDSDREISKNMFDIAHKLAVAMKRKPTDAVRTIIEEIGPIRIEHPKEYEQFVDRFKKEKTSSVSGAD